MEQDKSISQLGRASSIDGTELLVYAKGTTNGSMTVSQVAKLTEDKMLSGVSLGVPDGTEALPAKRGDSAGTLNAGAVSELHFRKYWQASDGTIDDVGHPDAPYGLNELWLTYEEAVKVAADTQYHVSSVTSRTILGRTNFEAPEIGGSAMLVNFQAPNAEVLNVGRLYYVSSFSGWLNGAPKLTKIIGAIDLNSFTGTMNNSLKCPLLAEVNFLRLKRDFDIRHLASISRESLMYLVSKAANGNTVITVTVHSDVYAKLTDENNAEWFYLLTVAAARNISFATAES